MKQNVGSVDRLVRIAGGALLLLVGVGGFAGVVPVAVGPLPQALTSVVLVLLGVVFAVTGLRRTCLLYRAVGVSTADSTRD
ncbi:MAG: DUF2892 domain-containing protein [Haloferacaceae archaeon]